MLTRSEIQVAADIVLGNAGVLVPGQYRWARALGWMCVLAILCVLSFNLAADTILRIAAAMTGEEFTTRAAASTSARLAAVVVGSIAMLVTYRLAVRLGERRPAPELGLRALAPELAIGIGIGATLMAMIIAVLWAAEWVSISTSPVTAVSESLKLSIQSGVIEEVLTRLIIFRLLWRVGGVWPALVITALLFGGLHLTNPDASLFAALCLVAGEGVAAGLYLLTGRIWASIGMHAGWNFAQGWLFGSAVSGIDVASGGPLLTQPVEEVAVVLSGGGFGPESSIAALGISLGASALFLIMAWQRGRFEVVDG